MKFCYADESGMGAEPIATMVGIVVDSRRMHLTKRDWRELLDVLREITGRNISELKAANFYAGNGIWRDLKGDFRSSVISAVTHWLAKRKHHLVYAAVDKERFLESQAAGLLPEGLGTIWRMLGFHLTLAVQRYSQHEERPKGHTLLVFDHRDRERLKFPELIATPPAWSDAYYTRGAKQDALDQIVDVPYFNNSKDVALLQVADFLAFFFRRYAEIKSGRCPVEYSGEEDKITGWVEKMAGHSIGRQHMYPRVKRNEAHDVFHGHAPACICGL